jgi:hypothetical protein
MLLLFTPGAPGGTTSRPSPPDSGGAAMGEQDRMEFFLRHDTFWVEGA